MAMVFEEATACHTEEPETLFGRRRNLVKTSPRNGENVCHQVVAVRWPIVYSTTDVAVDGPVVLEVERLESRVSLRCDDWRCHAPSAFGQFTLLHDATARNLSDVVKLAVELGLLA
jgi:hypothetical protein